MRHQTSTGQPNRRRGYSGIFSFCPGWMTFGSFSWSRFASKITRREGPIPRGPDGNFVELQGFGKEAVRELSSNRLELTWLFDLVNSELRACRIPNGALPRG